GYSVVAPDLFSRAHDLDPDDIVAVATSMTRDELRADLEAAVGLLRGRGATSVGITGFCMGGRISHRAALEAAGLGIAASVAFYAGATAQELAVVQSPTLMFFGGRAPYIPPADIEAVRAHHPDDVVVYPEASHGFMRDGSDDYAPAEA